MPLRLLLLLLLVASFLRLPPPASAACSPKRCGDLTVAYPFWLEEAGQPPCGSPSFQLRCNATTAQAFLAHSVSSLYQVVSIFTENSSFVAVDHNLLVPSPGGCPKWWFNVSEGFGLAPYTISRKNRELLVLYNCTQRPPQGFIPTPCRNGSSSSSFRLGVEYGGQSRRPLPPACRLSVVPVLGFPAGDEYVGGMKGGFLLEWTPAEEQQQGRVCPASSRCGDLRISDPFWLTDWQTGQYCGPLDFEVDCLNSTTAVLRSSGLDGFEILAIDYKERSLLVFEQDKLTYLNDSGSSCHVPRWNTSSKLAPPFKISPSNLDLVFYNCTTAAAAATARRKPAVAQMRCGNKSSAFVRATGGYYNGSVSYEGYSVEGCDATMVPVLGSPSSGEVNSSDYMKLISNGFLLTWDHPPLEVPLGVDGTKRFGRKIILIVVTSAAAALLFPCIYVLIWHRKGRSLGFLLCKKTSSSTERNYEAMIVSYGSLAPKRYMYSELMKITSSRSDQLGRGGYGVVFKGRLHDGRFVAVKFLHDCKGNGDEFVNEVMSIGRTSHVNVVSLFGFCLEGSKRALIYEYMPNGSLDKYIYSENPKEILGWERLYAIAIGIARGLEYLHDSCNTRIVHFDIKPQNILLDKDFSPKIADFGLAKLSRTKESKLSMTGARGTIGFIAPEVYSRTFGVVSTKSDVYSYGMMLLEMVGGRKNVNSMAEKSSEQYFPGWIYDHFAQDDGLQACDATSENDEMARKMTFIGLWCIQILPIYRPTIAKVLEMFERSLDEMEMPPKQNFGELLEDSAHNMSAENASSTIPEDLSLVNSENLQTLPSL